MAEYSKAEKLQALEFLTQYLNDYGGDVKNRVSFTSIPELGDYLDDRVNQTPSMLKDLVNSLDDDGKPNQYLVEELKEDLERILGKETRFIKQANYAPFNESHHPISTASQYTMGAELPMDQARELYELADEKGYAIGSQLHRMRSLPEKAHSQAHISAKTGGVDRQHSGPDVFAPMNTALREIKEYEKGTNLPGKNRYVGTALALATPYLEQENYISESIYNSPAQVALRQELANRLGVSINELDDVVAKETSRGNSRTLAQASKAKLGKATERDPDALDLNIAEIYDEILNRPEIAAAQDKLLSDLQAGISDKEIRNFNHMLNVAGNYRVAAAVPQSVEEAMLPIKSVPSVQLKDADSLVNSMSKRAVRQERIAREERELMTLENKPSDGVDVNKVNESNLKDRPREIKRIRNRLRPGAEELLAPMAQDIPGLNDLIKAFKANRARQ